MTTNPTDEERGRRCGQAGSQWNSLVYQQEA
nr:MAG TPA: hypothetical protein [Caudoviricetes sp.]